MALKHIVGTAVFFFSMISMDSECLLLSFKEFHFVPKEAWKQKIKKKCLILGDSFLH